MKTTIVFALVCISTCFGAAFQALPDSTAGEGKCVSSSFPNIGELKYGESKTVPGECLSVTCAKGGKISAIPCGLIAIPAGCKLVEEDLSKPYPECCAKTKC